MRKRGGSDQLTLFPGMAPESPPRSGVEPAEVSAEVHRLGADLPGDIRLGGSTWSFPGWAGLVYAGRPTEARLAKEGLAAYARHPLLRGAGLDRTWYQPLTAADFADYAAVVPEGFRFLVKALEALTVARWPDHPRYGAERGQPNPRFFDPVFAADQVVAPYVEGLGAKRGALLFQLSPQDLGPPQRFAARLHAFLAALPRGPVYAVELRNREVLTRDYAEALAGAGAVHCLNVHPRMPEVRAQARLAGIDRPGAPATVVRWLLGPGMTYEEAGRRYAPFDRLQREDPDARQALAELAREALAAGRPFLCTVNNNAEGCAPLSILGLAREIVRTGGG
ncbi:MAG TPA: DUF72 domain-containing protein [Acidobacteria bacterium]|nr:DUF72 domain-containing protein [Acidobacteriota bacterium]